MSKNKSKDSRQIAYCQRMRQRPKDIKGGRLYVKCSPSKLRRVLKNFPGITKIRSDGNGGSEIIHTFNKSCYKLQRKLEENRLYLGLWGKRFMKAW